MNSPTSQLSSLTPTRSQDGSPTPRRWHWLVWIAGWLLGNGLMLAFRSGYPFPPFDQLDTWFYTSYLWDLKTRVAEFGDTYYGARVSWIYPGAALHAILPPAAANIAHKMLFSGLLAVAWGAVGWWRGGWSLALLGISLAVFLPQVVTAMHGDYTDTAVLTYGSLAVALIYGIRGARRKWVWTAGAGICLALMTVANLGAAVNIAVAIGLFHAAWVEGGLSQQAKYLAVYVAAAGTTLLILQGIHMMLGGTWSILAAQLRMVKTLNEQGTQNQWFIAGWDWMPLATWLMIPFVVCIWGGLITLLKPPTEGESRRAVWSLVAALAFSLAISFYLQLRGSMVLYLPYYAISLLCLAVPLLLSLVGLHRSSPPWQLGWSVFGWGALAWVTLVPFPITYNKHMGWLRIWAGASEAYLGIALLMGLTVLLVVLVLRRRVAWLQRVHPVLFVAFLVFLSVPRTHPHFSYLDRLRERYEAVHDAVEYLEEHLNHPYYFWVNRQFSDAASLASIQLWQYGLYDLGEFPELQEPTLSDADVVVPTPPGGGEVALALATERLGRAGFTPIDSRIVPIPGENDIGFDLVIFQVGLLEIDPENPPPDAPRPSMIAGFEYSGPNRYTDQMDFFANNGGHVEIDASTSTPWFIRTTPIDFTNTWWRPLPGLGTKSRHLILVFYFNAEGNTRVTLEDEWTRQFFEVEFTSPGRHVVQVPLPDDSGFYRFRFYSPVEDRAPLPTNLNVYEVIGE